MDGSYTLRSNSARCVGFTNDALAHVVSGVGMFLEAHEILREVWIVGEEEYVCNESLITPILISQMLVAHEDAFNYYLSSLQLHFEPSLRKRVARSRILQN